MIVLDKVNVKIKVNVFKIHLIVQNDQYVYVVHVINGRRCQFTTSGFGLSLDAILGYHILPNINIIHQPSIVKFSLTLTMIFIIIGFINGIFTLITFKNKTIREVGCGLYLLGSSITSLIIMIIFGLKFFILIFTQIGIISNR